MVALRVLGRYTNREVAYQPGQIINVDEATAAHLMADAPGCFVLAVQIAAIEDPPADTMIRRSQTRRK